jgi:hypothetical protein
MNFYIINLLKEKRLKMVKKFKELPEDVSKNLKGFEDIFQDYVETEEIKERKRINRDLSRNSEIYELQNFLEEENSRLSNIEIFFSKKVPAKISFSQTQKLIVEQLKRKNELKEKIIPSLKKQDSQILKNLAHLFNAHFS